MWQTYLCSVVLFEESRREKIFVEWHDLRFFLQYELAIKFNIQSSWTRNLHGENFRRTHSL